MTSRPFLIPYCALCEQPVQRFAWYLPIKSPGYVDFDAQCCGKTQGAHVSRMDLHRIRVTNEKIWLVVKKGRVQGVAEARRG